MGSQLQGLDEVNANTSPCAACKLLRRRCAQECPFSPYFPPQDPQKFASVHKIFGASNVSKMLMKVPENQRADTASSLVYEANARLRDPVYGCLGTISALQQHVRVLKTELDFVRAELIRYQARDHPASAMIAAPAAANLSPATSMHLGSFSATHSDRTVSSLSPQSTASTEYSAVGSPTSTLASVDTKEGYQWHFISHHQC